jgi:hypothetical protein
MVPAQTGTLSFRTAIIGQNGRQCGINVGIQITHKPLTNPLALFNYQQPASF